MARHGQALLDCGYPIIPIVPGAKMPGLYQNGFWRPMPAWQNAEPDLATWSLWPDAGIGIRCGQVIGIDIDILDAELVDRIEKLLYEKTRSTSCVRIGLAPKKMLIYRAEQPFRGMKRHPIEILGTGQQFVAYAIHEKTGRPYAWPFDSLDETDISDLPVITEAQAREFLDQAWQLIPDQHRQGELKIYRGDGTAERMASDLAGTIEAVTEALEFIPNPDLNYDDWVRIGMALKGATGQDGEALFLVWSAKSQKDVPATTMKAWRSFRPTRIGAGTIYEVAQNYGWHPGPHLILNRAAADQAARPHPAQALLDRLLRGEIQVSQGDDDVDQAPAPRPVATPYGIFDIDGVLKLMVDYVLATSISPQPRLALGAALACLGALAGRRYRSPTGLRTNIYAIGVCDSGGGKDHPRKCVKIALAKAGLARYHGGDRIASGQGLISAITKHPSLLFQIDEFGHFIKKLLNGGHAATHVAEIWHALTELFTSADSLYLGTEFANKKDRPREDIHNPNVCVFGTTVPGPLWKAMESGQIGDGSIARFLVFQSDNHYPDRVKNPADLDHVPDQLIEGLKAIARGGGNPNNNLDQLMSASVAVQPLQVEYSYEAEEILDQLSDQQINELRRVAGTMHTSILARLYEHTVKVAMIRAISADPDLPVIQASHVLWARELVWQCTTTLLNAIEAEVADNQYEADRKKILNKIRKAGPDGITGRDLNNAAPIRANLRKEIITDLIESGLIEFEVTKGKTRPLTIYRHVGQ